MRLPVLICLGWLRLGAPRRQHTPALRALPGPGGTSRRGAERALEGVLLAPVARFWATIPVVQALEAASGLAAELQRGAVPVWGWPCGPLGLQRAITVLRAVVWRPLASLAQTLLMPDGAPWMPAFAPGHRSGGAAAGRGVPGAAQPEIARNKQRAEIAEAEAARNVAMRQAETLRAAAQARAKADQDRVHAEALRGAQGRPEVPCAPAPAREAPGKAALIGSWAGWDRARDRGSSRV